MTRRIISAWLPVVAVVVFACSSDAHRVTEPFDQAPTTLSVTLNLKGDASAADPEYGLYIDDALAGTIRAGETFEKTIPAGTHTVGLQSGRLSAFAKQVTWCELGAPILIFAQAARRSVVSLSAECPSLDGVGDVALTFSGIPPGLGGVGVTLDRTNGPAFSSSFGIVPNTERVVPLPPGIYHMSMKGPCLLVPAIFGGIDPVVIRASQTLRRSYAINQCIP